LRVDIALNRLCLTRSRSEAKNACEAGAVLISGRAAKASQEVAVGDRITLRFTLRVLEVKLLELPGKSVSKKAAREMYEVLRDQPVEGQ
jgi:ribosomal 50S subunit-recycling heat shock protein